MDKHIEPSRTAFDAAEQTVLDILKEKAPGVMTRAGSVIRELLVRPMSYIGSWFSSNMERTARLSSVSYLKTSQETDNPVADAVASNYFVTRRNGTHARGVITVTVDVPILRLPAGAVFHVDDVILVTETRIAAFDSNTYERTDNIQYVPIIAVGDFYAANVPVMVSDYGNVEIDAGAPVTLGFSDPSILSADLTSPVSGGSAVETDAELMRRAEFNTAESGIGSYYGIKKKLSKAPVSVTGLSVAAGEDVPLFRARYNSANINPGGFIDCYVRTQSQAAVDTVSTAATYDRATGQYTAEISGNAYAGLYSVSGVRADGVPVSDYSVTYGTASAYSTPAGSRLSADQTVAVSFRLETAAVADLPVSVTVSYMPGIHALQTYMDADSNRYIGQDISVKAAVPVNLKISCILKELAEPAGEDTVKTAVQAISDYVNSVEVGTGIISFSDIKNACETAVPGYELRLPCIISASYTRPDGASDSMVSDTGILDIRHPAVNDSWDPAVTFFSCTPDHIRLDTL